MEDEKKIQIRQYLKLLCVLIFACLYAWGGMENKWLRRFVAPTFLCLSSFYFCRDWRVLLQMPLLFGSLSLGYGADITWIKILKRSIFGLANASTAWVHFWTCETKKFFYILIGLNYTFILLSCIILGVFNPLHARAEELLIGFSIGIISMFMPKERRSR